MPVLALCAGSALAATSVSLQGTVQDASGAPLENAVAQLKIGKNLLPAIHTLSDVQGHFALQSSTLPDLDPAATAPGSRRLASPAAWTVNLAGTHAVRLEAIDVQGHVRAQMNLPGASGTQQLHQPQALLSGQPQGLYVLYARQGGTRTALGTLYHRGGPVAGTPQWLASRSGALAMRTAGGEELQVIVRKAGFIPDTLIPASTTLELGNIVLARDPLEDRIDSVMALMTLKQKIGQMTQPLSATGSSSTTYGLYGSTLDGGDQVNTTFLNSMNNKLASWTASAKIPVLYGKDAVHGHAGMAGATIFPHNIGLGATRDSALVRRIGEATAKELWSTGVDLNFAPAISVPQDERWGRTYEGFGETAELAVTMGPAMVRGLQGDRYDAPWRVISTAKHYVADGGTTSGKDRANSVITDAQLRSIHLPGYQAVVEQGVLSVMASFNQVNGTHQHIDSLRLTGILKTELGFDGYVISDWDGIGNSNDPGATGDYSGATGQGGIISQEAVRKAINAGVDLAMEASYPSSFMNYLNTLVSNGSVSQSRIDDAVRRILRAKFRAGRMDNFAGPAEYVGKSSTWLGCSAHRALAREAVRKSQVLLKNESALPLPKTAKIYVMGTHADNSGYQSGGWTLSWQGMIYNISGATSILAGMKLVAPGATFTASATDADYVVYVTGEEPYAEWKGDNTSLALPRNTSESALATYKSQGKKIVTVLVSGRPLPVASLISKSDAFLAAWLPGSEGAGVADVLFGDYAPTGKLPHSWPAALADVPINDGDGKTPQFPYGFGLTY